MQSELSTIEVFNLLNGRYDAFLRTGGFSKEGGPFDVQAHNAVLETLKDAVDKFTEGRLQVVVSVK